MNKIHIEVPEATPLMNQMLRESHRKRSKERNRWAWMIKLAIKEKPEAPFDACTVHIVRYSSGYPDWDNLYGGLKNVLDCLVVPTRKNPAGLGLIKNDTPQVIKSLTAMPGKCKKGEERTEILIYECH